MSNLRVNAQGIYWRDSLNTECLVSFQNFFANKSGLSLQPMPTSMQSLPQLFVSLLQDIQERFQDNWCWMLSQSLAVALTIPKLISDSRPMQVLELGCGKGELSYYLAQLMGAINPNSMLYCVSDILESDWEPLIAQVEHSCRLSYLATDYDSISLSPGFFDLIIINSANLPGDAQMILSQSLKLCRKGGQIICIAKDNPLYESIFQLYFSTRKRYEITPLWVIQLASMENCDWEYDVKSSFLPSLKALCHQLSELLSQTSPSAHTQWQNILHEIEVLIPLTVENFDSQWKNRLIILRELLMSYVLAPDQVIQNINRDRLISYLTEINNF